MAFEEDIMISALRSQNSESNIDTGRMTVLFSTSTLNDYFKEEHGKLQQLQQDKSPTGTNSDSTVLQRMFSRARG